MADRLRLRGGGGHANHAPVTVGGGHNAGSAADAESAWRAVRNAPDIQYAPLPEIKQPPAEAPAWLRTLGRILEAIFEPIGRLLGMSWPVFQYVLIALAAVLVAALLWRMLAPLVEQWRSRAPVEALPDWTPERAEAVALLEEADRLAAEGRYGEATHLLLRRSVHQIAQARPDWLQPASTAREISALALLPEAGRQAFGIIAGRVERCLFALRDLDAGDWTAARAAYADFALVELRR